jgi:DNA-binding transcriptional LysR family regulator
VRRPIVARIVPDADAVLQAARSVLVIDWPSRDVPDGLAAAGLEVIVKGGPGPLQPKPDHIDLVYAYRPAAELPGIAALAKELGAQAVWHGVALDEPELAEARRAVEAEGLAYVHGVDIVQAARAL